MKKLAYQMGILLITVLLFSGISQAAPWQSGWVATEHSGAYWDNKSFDGPNKNVGFLLPKNGDGSPYPYLGQDDGTAYTDFSFTGGKTCSGGNCELKFEIAGLAGENEFGYYDKSDNSLHPIFFGSNIPGDVATFSKPSEYGFYIKNSGGTWYTESDLNASGQTSDQHFAIFEESANVYWIAMEDLPFSKSDKDYNDMIVRMDLCPSVPEPATMLLLGFGLIGLAGVRRFKK
jgi:hypothetical protein